jgi:predicted  nucleic acid-binding Zn-ribbon protein
LIESLRALVKLSKVDAAARDIDRELQAVPERLAEMRSDIDRLAMLLARERDELGQAERLRASHEEEIVRCTESLARAKAKAAKARNSREAEAVERELEVARRSIKEREAECERLTAIIDAQRKTLAEHAAEFEKLRSMLVEDEAAATTKLEALRARRAEVTAGRDVVAALIDRATLRRYEQVRDKRGTGVCEVQPNGVCGGCRMQIPPQRVLELVRGTATELLQCPHCQRFVYTAQLLED